MAQSGAYPRFTRKKRGLGLLPSPRKLSFAWAVRASASSRRSLAGTGGAREGQKDRAVGSRVSALARWWSEAGGTKRRNPPKGATLV